MKYILNTKYIAIRDLKHPWVLAIVMVLIINAFGSMLMISQHQDMPPSTMSSLMDHHSGEHGPAMQHCGGDAKSGCADSSADFDCSVSHCSPAGVAAMALLTPSDPGASEYSDFKSNYQFLASSLPYIPPIAAHI